MSKVEVEPAVAPRGGGLDDVPDAGDRFYAVDKNADLSPIEVAIARSHRKCWEELVQSTSTYMVVCEDDAVLQTTSFEPFLRALLSSQGRRNKFRFDIFYFVNGRLF